MKKKGLIISTVVMVVVLIASLTTATYAWFTTSNVTFVQGFGIEVTSSNAVNIGLKTDNTYAADAGITAFMSGDCTYEAAAAGTLGKGTWKDGQEGLSATVNHGITWGAQSQAVGVVNEEITDATKATIANTQLWNVTGGTKAVAANIAKKGTSEVLSEQKFATANSDYAYLFLGAAPTKTLKSSELVVCVDYASNPSAQIGILAALHVAYRLNSNDEWHDEAIFGSNAYTTKQGTLATNLTAEQKATYKSTYGNDAGTNTTYALTIPGLTTEANKIDQIEIVIYIAGADSNCKDQAKGAKGDIKIFFHTVDPDVAG